jgi:DNA-binding CsgD family transcriptional regulator
MKIPPPFSNPASKNDRIWDRLQKNTNGLFSEYFHLIAGKFPQLTSKQLRIAALIKARKTSEEIAGMIETTLRAVERLRERIRENLSLSSDTDLIVFFSAL